MIKTEGFLSNINKVKAHYTIYKWSNNKLLTFFRLIISQIQVFLRLVFLKNKNSIIYINTAIPFGAAIACRLLDYNFVFHIHEDLNRKKLLYFFLKMIYSFTNKKTIFVSNFLKKNTFNCNQSIVAYNNLNNSFLNQISISSKEKKNILMVSSLKKYKGVNEFIIIADGLPDYCFQLVLSCSEDELDSFKSDLPRLPENLDLYSTQQNLHSFYSQAKLLLVLTDKNLCVETFGMTILESMSYGVPSIVPEIGGPTELIKNNINGFLIDSKKTFEIKSKINEIFDDVVLYKKLRKNCFKISKKFNQTKQVDLIEKYIFNE